MVAAAGFCARNATTLPLSGWVFSCQSSQLNKSEGTTALNAMCRSARNREIFSATGELMTLREDIGRHNAVDKVVGRALLDGSAPISGALLAVSGRAGYEVVQKAIAAGIPILVAVGAPSTLAVATAVRFGLTLVGFMRGERFNVYSAPERVRGARLD